MTISHQPLTEFDIIGRYFTGIEFSALTATVNVGDDCAVLSLPGDQQLAISIDTLVAGRHFPDTADAYDIATRSVAVAVSDLAAMGAKPFAFTLALTLPDIDEPWLTRFSQGLRAAAANYQLSLVGGDTTKGPLVISLQVHGVLSKGSGLLRSGAKPGDGIFVTGSLGDAAAALDVINGKIIATDSQKEFFHRQFYVPSARVAMGQQLLTVANAAIDVSDGLMADLTHIAQSSRLGATIFQHKLPLSSVLLACVDEVAAVQYALSGGDDYELCFTAPLAMRQQLTDIATQTGVAITEIGEINSGSDVECIDEQGEAILCERMGYDHFSRGSK
jgi:thiamine-monophosphate kinase